MQKQKRKGLGDILVEAGLISKEQLDKALNFRKKQAKKLGVLLVSEGIVNPGGHNEGPGGKNRCFTCGIGRMQH